MTCSGPFILRPKSLPQVKCRLLNTRFNRVTAVTRDSGLHGHHRGRLARSPYSFYIALFSQWFPPSVPTGQAGSRVGAGAGATPVFVAAIRHDTSLARMGSLVGRSRTYPSSFIANPNAIRIPNELVSKE